MTTTPQVDLREVRELADILQHYFPSADCLEKAGTAMSALADEVEALRKRCEALREANSTFATNSILPDHLTIVEKAELAALKAVGPDGLPPLPHATINMLLGDDWEDLFTADQMQDYARAVLALAQKGGKE